MSKIRPFLLYPNLFYIFFKLFFFRDFLSVDSEYVLANVIRHDLRVLRYIVWQCQTSFTRSEPGEVFLDIKKPPIKSEVFNIVGGFILPPNHLPNVQKFLRPIHRHSNPHQLGYKFCRKCKPYPIQL